MTTETQPLLLSFSDASALLGISRALLYSMWSDGRLGPMVHKIGRRSLFVCAELERWVEAGMPPRIQWQRQAQDKRDDESGFTQQKKHKPTDYVSAEGKKRGLL